MVCRSFKAEDVIWLLVMSCLHYILLTQSVYNFGFDVLVFISHFIELLHINLPKVIDTNYNKNNQTTHFVTATPYLNNLYVFLYFLLLLKIAKKLAETYIY